MKLEEILVEGIHQTVESIANQLSNKLGEKWLIDRKTSFRMWTRGDGVRYKEPSKLVSFYNSTQLKNLIKKGKIDKSLNTETDVMDAAWEHLKSLPGAKYIGTIRGEFGSDKYEEAYKIGKVIFIRRGNSAIQYASASVLRNTDVWHWKKA